MAEVDPRDEWRHARKKPVVIDFRGPYTDTDTVETIEGDFEIDDDYLDEHGGYYIIRGIEGEEYPCGADIFRDNYDILGPTDSYECLLCERRKAGSSAQKLYRKQFRGNDGREYVIAGEVCEECSL